MSIVISITVTIFLLCMPFPADWHFTVAKHPTQFNICLTVDGLIVAARVSYPRGKILRVCCPYREVPSNVIDFGVYSIQYILYGCGKSKGEMKNERQNSPSFIYRSRDNFQLKRSHMKNGALISGPWVVGGSLIGITGASQRKKNVIARGVRFIYFFVVLTEVKRVHPIQTADDRLAIYRSVIMPTPSAWRYRQQKSPEDKCGKQISFYSRNLLEFTGIDLGIFSFQHDDDVRVFCARIHTLSLSDTFALSLSHSHSAVRVDESDFSSETRVICLLIFCAEWN